ncbi:MAG: hypothetical protein U9R74_03915 [Pseudomonadota bacterium]|nr:hypothetical protein [Pseudomonadota bacterium]
MTMVLCRHAWGAPYRPAHAGKGKWRGWPGAVSLVEGPGWSERWRSGPPPVAGWLATIARKIAATDVLRYVFNVAGLPGGSPGVANSRQRDVLAFNMHGQTDMKRGAGM